MLLVLKFSHQLLFLKKKKPSCFHIFNFRELQHDIAYTSFEMQKKNYITFTGTKQFFTKQRPLKTSIAKKNHSIIFNVCLHRVLEGAECPVCPRMYHQTCNTVHRNECLHTTHMTSEMYVSNNSVNGRMKRVRGVPDRSTT